MGTFHGSLANDAANVWLSMRRALLVGMTLLAIGALSVGPASACEGIGCHDPGPQVIFQPGTLQASALSGAPGSSFRVAGSTTVPERTYSLLTPCQYTDPRQGACESGDFACDPVPNR